MINTSCGVSKLTKNNVNAAYYASLAKVSKSPKRYKQILLLEESYKMLNALMKLII
jgi:hypothetical protein